MMESFFLTYKSSVVHYRRNDGKEKPVLFCFHGYGESASTFDFLEKYIGKDFCIIAIDLPFHGQTTWNEGLNFSVEDLLAIIQQILKDAAIISSEFLFIGYSMGARVSLALTTKISLSVKKIILIAPDGLKMNFWYWLSTQTFLGNRIFKFVMQKPEFFLNILRRMNHLHIINQSIFKFIDHYINNKQVRDDLYNRWTTMRKFKPSLKKVKHKILQEKINVRLLYGEYDRIIRFERAKPFLAGIENLSELVVIPGGHQLLHEKNCKIIIQLIEK
jgi:pimeloyl-ACP methyl ester carboxylesterase